MKQLALLIAPFFVAGLFTAGTAVGMSHEDKGEMEKSIVEEQHPDLGAIERRGVDSVAARDLDREQVRELESLLQNEGYNITSVDGQLDMDERESLREFQREEGLVATGEPNDETLRALAADPEQQEFFGLSPEFGVEEEGVIEKEGELEKREKTEETPVLNERIEETPRTID